MDDNEAHDDNSTKQDAPAQQDTPYAYLCPSCGTRGVEAPGQVCGLCLAISSMGRTPPPPPA